MQKEIESSQEYCEGYFAYTMQSASPYTRGTSSYVKWLIGYNDAKEDNS